MVRSGSDRHSETPLPSDAGAGSGAVAPSSGTQQAASLQPDRPEPEWGNEISERVERFRQRRATLRDSHGAELNLSFDFEPHVPGKSAGRSGTCSAGGPRPGELDVVLEEPRRLPGDLRLDSLSLPATSGGMRKPADDSQRADAGFFAQGRAPASELFDPAFSAVNPMAASDVTEMLCAPLGKRLIAGVVDGVLLLGAGCLFAAIFLLAGGHVHLGRLGLVILILLAGFWLFTYFGSFSALTLSTPGQAAMGLAIRNWDGELPNRRECLLRGFGYLVSVASLMLGFLWAAMDSDRLAWHDHISGTLLAENDAA